MHCPKLVAKLVKLFVNLSKNTRGESGRRTHDPVHDSLALNQLSYHNSLVNLTINWDILTKFDVLFETKKSKLIIILRVGVRRSHTPSGMPCQRLNVSLVLCTINYKIEGATF